MLQRPAHCQLHPFSGAPIHIWTTLASPWNYRGLGCGLDARKIYCLSSMRLLKLSRVLVRLNEEMQKAATPTGPVIKDS